MDPHALTTTTAFHQVSPSMRPFTPYTHPPPNLLQAALAPVTVELWSLPSWSCSTPPCRNDAHLNGSLGAPLHTLRVHSVTADSLGGSDSEAQLPPWALTLTPTLILIRTSALSLTMNPILILTR